MDDMNNDEIMIKTYGIIYKTTNLINNKIYIGQTTRTSILDYFGSGNYIKNAIKKYGKGNFTREILEGCINQEELDKKEKFWIAKLNPEYNIDLGGIGAGKMSEETKIKISKKLKNKYKNSKDNPMYGKSVYDLWVEKYGNKKANIMWNDKYKKMKGENHPNFGISNYERWVNKYGKDRADELLNKSKENFSKSIKGKLCGKNNPMYGKRPWNYGLTKETDIRICEYSDKLKNKEVSKFTRIKMSKAKIGKYDGENNPHFGKSNYDIWINKYGKEEADRRKRESVEKRLLTIKLNKDKNYGN